MPAGIPQADPDAVTPRELWRDTLMTCVINHIYIREILNEQGHLSSQFCVQKLSADAYVYEIGVTDPFR